MGDTLVSPKSLRGNLRTMHPGGNRSRSGKVEEKPVERSRRLCQRAELGDLGKFFLAEATSMDLTATPYEANDEVGALRPVLDLTS